MLKKFLLFYVLAAGTLIAILGAILAYQGKGPQVLVASITSLFGVLQGIVSGTWFLKATREPTAEGRTGKKRGGSEHAKKAPRASGLIASFDSGLYGGLIGGAIAGLIIAVFYYLAKADPITLLLTLGYAAVAGAIFGVCSQQTIHWFLHLRSKIGFGFLFNAISGGTLGGGLGGILAGALGGLVFGLNNYDFVNPGFLAVGAMLGVLCLLLAILLYDYDGRVSDVMRALIIAVVISAFIAAFGSYGLRWLKIENRFFNDKTTLTLGTVGGAVIGLLQAALGGFLVGLTLLLYRVFQDRHRRPK